MLQKKQIKLHKLDVTLRELQAQNMKIYDIHTVSGGFIVYFERKAEGVCPSCLSIEGCHLPECPEDTGVNLTEVEPGAAVLTSGDISTLKSALALYYSMHNSQAMKFNKGDELSSLVREREALERKLNLHLQLNRMTEEQVEALLR